MIDKINLIDLFQYFLVKRERKMNDYQFHFFSNTLTVFDKCIKSTKEIKNSEIL